MKFDFFSYRSKLLLGFSLAIIIPLLLFAVITIRSVRHSSYNDFVSFTGLQMEYFEGKVQDFLKSVENYTRYLASHPVVTEADSSITSYVRKTSDFEAHIMMRPSEADGLESEIYEVYKRFASAHPNAAYLYLGVDETGGYVQWPETLTDSSYDPRLRPWYIRALDDPGRPLRTSAYAWDIDDAVIVSTVMTIENEGGEFIGVQGICMSLDFLTEMATEAEIGRSGFVIIAEEDGTQLANSRYPEYNFSSIAEFNPALSEELKKGSGFFEIVLDGEPYVGLLNKSDFSGWNFIGLIEEGELLESSNVLAANILITFIIIAAFFAFISVLITKTFSKPVFSVIGQMREIEKGNFNINISDNILKRSDELGILGRAGESMRKNLKDKIEKLKTLNNTGRILASTLDWYQSIQSSSDIIFRVAEADRGMILLADRDETTLEVYITRGIDNVKMKDGGQVINDKEIPLELEYHTVEKIKEEIYSRKKPKIYLKDEINLDTPKFVRDWMEAAVASLVIPMVVKKRLVGFIILEPRNDDLDFIFTVSRQVSIAIENSRLYYDAITDGLTGLHIHRFFQLQMNRELKRSERYGKPVSLMMLDIDHFKKFNDTYGHRVGDRVLKGVARIISENVREVDIACRYGGEELAIILPETDIEQAKIVSEKIRSLIEKENFVEGETVTVSIGVVQASLSEGVENRHLIEVADRCLYKAKIDGRNCVVACDAPVEAFEDIE